MPITMGSVFGRTAAGQGTGKPQTTAACSCPACVGLECLERPRFFAGQLLSEAELNGEVDYALAKQRLHNRYLHGVGTVCGLEVVCSNCDGQVIVKPGYAIDPCGNDVIVCAEQSFDVLKAIQACCNAVKKKNRTGCDPYRPVPDGCTGIEQRWCITVEYKEIPAQPVTPLRGKNKTCSCGGSCGCSGGCGCSNGGKAVTNCGCSGTAAKSNGTSTSAGTSCEPTRVLESFQLGVVPDPGDCGKLSTLLQDTLLFQLVGCLESAVALKDSVSAKSWQIIVLALESQLTQSQVSNNDAFLACCQFRQFVIDLFTNSEFLTNCSVLKLFDTLPCVQPPQNRDSDPQYLGQVQDTITGGVFLLIEYLKECVCHQLIPPCPDNPTDDRLILACLTVKDGKITQICNFSCRKFAGAFPSMFYWLSLIPIVPFFKYLIEIFCCSSVYLPRTVPRGEAAPGGGDVTAGMRKTVVEGNFALPRMFTTRVRDFAGKFTPQNLMSAFPAQSFNLATVRGMSSENAQQALAANGVSFDRAQVTSRVDIPVSLGDLKGLFAAKGDHVILYEQGGTVLEVRRTPAPSEQTSSSAVDDLRKQVENLRAEVADLKSKRRPNG